MELDSNAKPWSTLSAIIWRGSQETGAAPFLGDRAPPKAVLASSLISVTSIGLRENLAFMSTD
jgi:hypothetical protein